MARPVSEARMSRRARTAAAGAVIGLLIKSNPSPTVRRRAPGLEKHPVQQPCSLAKNSGREGRRPPATGNARRYAC
jgi:hypothetical protein